MKKPKLTPIVLLVLGIGIFSCQKMLTDDLEEDKAPVGNPALLSEVKKFYQKELRPKMTAGIDRRRSALGADQKASTRKTPPASRTQVYALWKMSKMSTFQGKKDIVEVPILSSRRTVSLIKSARDSLGYTPDRTMVRTIFDRLVISRRKGSEAFRSQIVRYHPDRGYLEKHRYDVSHVHLYALDGFTGYLEYLTVEGERKAVVRVVDGKPVKRYYMGAKLGQKKNPISGRGQASSPRGMRASSGGEEICEEVCEEIFDEVCEGADPDDPGDIDCQLVPIDYDCWEECFPISHFCNDPDFWDSPECEEDEDGDEKENDPCQGVQKANDLKNNSSVSAGINNIKNSPTEIGYKFYVSDNSDYSTFNVGSPISGGSSNWSTNFTWDSNPNGGYTIGHLHNHPQGSAPNPTDAMSGVKISQMESSATVTQEEIDFYTHNFTGVVVSGSDVYTITIKDAGKYKTHQNNYYANESAAIATWQGHADIYLANHGSSVQEAGEYALLKMYGDSINLTRQGVNKNNENKELVLSSSGDYVAPNNPCK